MRIPLPRASSREVLALVCGLPCFLAYFRLQSESARSSILVSAVVSFLGFFATKRIVPVLKPYHLRKNLFGLDINKKGRSVRTCPAQRAAGLFAFCNNRWLAAYRPSLLKGWVFEVEALSAS